MLTIIHAAPKNTAPKRSIHQKSSEVMLETALPWAIFMNAESACPLTVNFESTVKKLGSTVKRHIASSQKGQHLHYGAFESVCHFVIARSLAKIAPMKLPIPPIASDPHMATRATVR